MILIVSNKYFFVCYYDQLGNPPHSFIWTIVVSVSYIVHVLKWNFNDLFCCHMVYRITNQIKSLEKKIRNQSMAEMHSFESELKTNLRQKRGQITSCLAFVISF